MKTKKGNKERLQAKEFCYTKKKRNAVAFGRGFGFKTQFLLLS